MMSSSLRHVGAQRLWAVAAMLLTALVFAPAQAEDVTTKLNDLTLRGNLELAAGKAVKDGVVLITHGTLAHNKMAGIANELEGQGLQLAGD